MAAGCFRVRLAREPSPAGGTHRSGPRRLPADRQRPRPRTGAAFWAADLAAVLATHPATGRGTPSFIAGMRRSKVSVLRWADVADAADGDGVLVTVRRSKTNQEGETRDVGFVKDGCRPRPPGRCGAAASPGAEGPGRARSRRRWWGLGFVAAAGSPASSRGRGPAMRRIALESQPTKVATRGARCRRRRWHRRGRDSLPWFKLGRGR